MAQQVEHVLGKDEVTGSSPVSSSKKTTQCGGFLFISVCHSKRQILLYNNLPAVKIGGL